MLNEIAPAPCSLIHVTCLIIVTPVHVCLSPGLSFLILFSFLLTYLRLLFFWVENSSFEHLASASTHSDQNKSKPTVMEAERKRWLSVAKQKSHACDAREGRLICFVFVVKKLCLSDFTDFTLLYFHPDITNHLFTVTRSKDCPRKIEIYLN